MLTVEELYAGYGTSEVLVGVSLEVPQGAVVSLIGPNGAGKTTTLRAISGLLKPTGGKVVIDGTPVQGMDASRIARLGLAHAPEGRRVFGTLSVEDNLLLGAYSRLPHFVGFVGKATSDLDRIFELFPRLKERRRQTAGTLSGGEQQMLAIGRALLSRPKLLLLDEPSMGLAPLMVQKVFETIVTISGEGVTILLIEQNAKLALEVSRRGYVMESGEITLSGPAHSLLHDPAVRAAYLGEAA